MRIHVLLLAAALSGCATIAPETRFANPVIDADFPDPAVLRAPDGTFFVYGTQGGDPIRNIQVARSPDLVHWTMAGDALPKKPAWAARTQDFWAPHVHSAKGRYYLYYSAKPDAALTDDKQGLCLAVATAAAPAGPFTDSGRPLQCGQGFVNIDPFVFADPVSGKTYLYWGSGFGPIKAQELAPDLLSFAPGSRPVPLVEPIRSDDPEDYRRLVEGAWVTYRNGYYYLFFSGDNCCGPKAHYAVMVGRSAKPLGPFEVRARPLNLVVEANARWVAPGHNSVIADDRGEYWLLYHAVDRRRSRSKASDEVNSRRVMLIDRLTWVDGWPEVQDKAPTSGEQPAPVIRRR